MDETYLTKKGYQKLFEQLEYLKTVKRRELSKAVGEARAHGDISENAVANISAVTEKAAAAVRPFELAIGGAGVFPDMNRPRIIWLGMNGDVARLVAFQNELEQTLQGMGFPREERPFRPHLTLGRIKAPKGMTGLADALNKGETFAAGRFKASVLGLFKSDLTPQGAIYTQLAGYPFTGKEGV